jgi:hypothetical protein
MLRENIRTTIPNRLRAMLVSEAKRSRGDIAVECDSRNLAKGSLFGICSIVSCLGFGSGYVETKNLIALCHRVPSGSSQAIHGLALVNAPVTRLVVFVSVSPEKPKTAGPFVPEPPPFIATRSRMTCRRRRRPLPAGVHVSSTSAS